MESWLDIAVRPLKHFADFSGRSTRSELAAFYLLILFATTFLNMFAGMVFAAVDFRALSIARDLGQLVFLCPILALFARRMHDLGRSGWWVLLALPALGANLWKYYRNDFSLDPLARVDFSLPMAIEIPAGLCLIALFVLLLWKDQEGTNSYGPNPRYDDPEATEISLSPEAGTAEP